MTSAMAALLLAWTLDLLFGEPPNRWHPVAALGRVLGPVGRRISTWRPAPAFAAGAIAWLALAALIGGAAWWVETLLASRLPALVAAIVLGLLLKPCFAWRMLRDEVAAVETALETQGLEAARIRLSRLVSRDVRQADEAAIRQTAIETLAENLNDSVIAPLAWYAVLGLPGAAVYRLANTADAMWGYRGRYEWAGKWAARADDALSWVPARITAALLLGVRPAWGALAQEARHTPSPNGGWPMGAMALHLGVRLAKPGVYVLNGAAPVPDAIALRGALSRARAAAWAAMALTAAALVAKGGLS
ncbi:adenosylcobinamide-phosphate synthase CbiB [Ideonella sp. YS5]|uniref:adenosylcobinamide-phosphate synthase CbiB n=1 Tax=Ideonella sp. YS5 TaxID=3453714 RepID=UPI003EECCDDE